MLNRWIVLVAVLGLSLSACAGQADEEGWEVETALAVPPAVAQAVAEGRPVDVVVEFGPRVATRSFDEIELDLSRDRLRRALSAPAWQQFRTLPHAVVRIDSPEQLQVLAHASGVRALHENIKVRRSGVAANLRLIEQPTAEARGYSGAAAAVAVIDSGVDVTHADFGSCSAAGDPGCRVVHALDVAPDDGQHDDATRHGSNVAGIVADVAPDADIVALDVFDGDYARASDILAAVDWVVVHRHTYGIAAMNMSFGTDTRYQTSCDNHLFASVIETARAAGVVSIVATGNDADKAGISAPACAPAAVAVGAVYASAFRRAGYSSCSETDVRADDVTCFSNSSGEVDLLGPGVLVKAGGVTMSGTSQAAPHVAAGYAIVAAAQPSWSVDEVVAHLVTTGVTLRDNANGVPAPRLDLDAATRFPTMLPAPEEPVDPPVSETPDPVEEPVEEPAEDEPAPFEPPSEGSWVFVEGDATTTSSPHVTLQIHSETPTTMMCVSNTTSCTDWQPYADSIAWELTPGGGKKTVRVWFMLPEELLEAQMVSDTITLL